MNPQTLLFQGLQSFLNQETKKDLDELYDMTDNYTDRWLSSGIFFLTMQLVVLVNFASFDFAARPACKIQFSVLSSNLLYGLLYRKYDEIILTMKRKQAYFIATTSLLHDLHQ